MFAEQQYYKILRSPDAIRLKVYVDRKTQEIERRKDQIGRLPRGSTEIGALSQDQRKAETLLRQDRELFNQHNLAVGSFLEQAIDMYSRSLQASDAFDDDGAIRMCSLWFANFDNPMLSPKVRNALDRIPSRKFVFLAHQLSARLTTPAGGSSDLHQENLQLLVMRMCKEHPFHSLYQVYCLRSERSLPNSNPQRRPSSRHEQSSSQERAAAAADIFDKLRNDLGINRIVRDVELVCDACLEWAKHRIKSFHAKRPNPPFYIHDSLLIRKIKQPKIPVLTSHLRIDPTLQYNDCVWIDHFEHVYETAGGINLPKITYCLGSDGKRYKQLVSAIR
jgi:ataxia telangiectasia mutated family protein